MKIVLILVVVAAIAGAGYWLVLQVPGMTSTAVNSPKLPQPVTARVDNGSDKTASIEAAINVTVVEDPDKDFEVVDADLKSL